MWTVLPTGEWMRWTVMGKGRARGSESEVAGSDMLGGACRGGAGAGCRARGRVELCERCDRVGRGARRAGRGEQSQTWISSWVRRRRGRRTAASSPSDQPPYQLDCTSGQPTSTHRTPPLDCAAPRSDRPPPPPHLSLSARFLFARPPCRCAVASLRPSSPSPSASAAASGSSVRPRPFPLAPRHPRSLADSSPPRLPAEPLLESYKECVQLLLLLPDTLPLTLSRPQLDPRLVPPRGRRAHGARPSAPGHEPPAGQDQGRRGPPPAAGAGGPGRRARAQGLSEGEREERGGGMYCAFASLLLLLCSLAPLLTPLSLRNSVALDPACAS